MKISSSRVFDSKLYRQNSHFPLEGQLELTYRCNYNCVHCYCQGVGDAKKELSFSEWKEILNQIQQAGCLWVGFTGGDPLTRPDFLDIYSYAKHKGFLVSVLTNGYGLNKKILKHFAKSPPNSVEITLNGITQKTYESITRKAGSFFPVRENIKKLKSLNITCYIKTNCLTLNSHEVVRIKKWVDGFLGKQSGYKYHFSYDPVIFPKLNGDPAPCAYRIPFQELLKIFRQDPDLSLEYKQFLSCEFPKLERPREFIYQCSSWKKLFSVDPYGRLKFCLFSDKFSVDLKKESFKDGFYKNFPFLRKEKFKTDSKCKTCSLLPVCNWCPAKAYLETGNEEHPVEYYCSFAEQTYNCDRLLKSGKDILQ